MTLAEFFSQTAERGLYEAVIDFEQAVALAVELGLKEASPRGMHASNWLTALCVGGQECRLGPVRVRVLN